MIRRIYSDLPKFKTLTFGSGLNVLLATKSPGATQKQTRNRAGKSSFLEVVHFLLGGNCKKDKDKAKESIFKNPALEQTVFGMEFDLAHRFTRVERNGGKPSPLVVAGDFTDWPIQPSAKETRFEISNDNWRVVLGKLMFGLDESVESYGPTFRSLVSYFIRRDASGGMAKAVAHATQQQLVDQQVNLSFLIGLDWTVPHAWHAVREREKQLEQLKKSVGEGALGVVVGSASSLKSELVLATDRARRLRDSVTTFKVDERYHDFEREASQLTQKLGRLLDDNTLDQRYLAELESSSSEESVAPEGDLENLYMQVGVVLPGTIQKRFDDVKAFHQSVYRNRRSYLLAEIQNTKQRIADRDKERANLDGRRAEVMSILNSAGALEHFTALQRELTKADNQVEVLRHKYETAEALESGGLGLKTERTRLVGRLRQDYAEEEKVIEEAILTFSAISSALYEDDASGTLTITPTENGPVFDPKITGSRSKGVKNMQIFCFDMMLTLLSLKRGRSPGFLIHDSHLFDGVDERQVGKALALGKSLAEKHGFQYIVTLNSNDIPKEVPAGFSVEAHALAIHLTDATEDGGLFGFRFD